MRTKYPLSASVRLIGIGYLGYHPEDRLGGEKEQILDAKVECLLDRVLVEGTVLPGPVAYEVGSIVGTLKSLKQGGSLLRGGTQFDLDGQLHSPSISWNSTFVPICLHNNQRGRGGKGN
jgi:hypothetical protein